MAIIEVNSHKVTSVEFHIRATAFWGPDDDCSSCDDAAVAARLLAERSAAETSALGDHRLAGITPSKKLVINDADQSVTMVLTFDIADPS